MDKHLGFKKQILKISWRMLRNASNEIALFKPNTFNTGKLMYSEDFHLIIPSGPPDTYVNNKLQSFSSKKLLFLIKEMILCQKEV